MGIKLFGKNILQTYNHHIMRLEYEGTVKLPIVPNVLLQKIDENCISAELRNVGTTVTVANLERLMRKNGSLCEGFVLRDSAGQSIGTIWVMYKGAYDLEYRIKNIDAYIFDVYVNDSFRGNGYAGEMVRQLMKYLHDKGIDVAYLAVSTKNKRAIQAYKKAGFTTICDRNFTRVLKINIPYHIL